MVDNPSEPKGSLNRVAAEAYPGVGLMLYTATEDYLAARLCLQHGLHSGTAIAAQAIEKTMKGILCFFDVKRFSGLKRGHKLPELNTELHRRSLKAAFEDDLLLRKFEALYWARYPDEKKHDDYPASVNYAEILDELDGLIFHLWDNMPESVGATAKGVLAICCDSSRHQYRILLNRNRMLRRWAKLYAEKEQLGLAHNAIWRRIWLLPDAELERLSCPGKPAIEIPIEAIFARTTLSDRRLRPE
jgi:HEPN domain-containing protein